MKAFFSGVFKSLKRKTIDISRLVNIGSGADYIGPFPQYLPKF